jgi:hypothetical protein
MRRITPVFAAALLAVPALAVLAGPGPGQTGSPVPEFPMRTFFTVRSAVPDASIPETVREEFEKDDGSPLKSVTVDLDGDGRPEKFVLCGVPAPSGGYQWLVFDPVAATVRGGLVGTIFFVGRETDGGYPRLETYWKQGGEMSIVSRYAFARGRYSRTATRALTLWEASEYFRAKGPLDLDRELVDVEIR